MRKSRKGSSIYNDWQSMSTELSILYIIPRKTYNGVLIQSKFTESRLWNELIKKEKIKNVLREWTERVNFDGKIDDEKKMDDIYYIKNNMFRMIPHKLEGTKYKATNDDDSPLHQNPQYFVLMWIPGNKLDGLTVDEYERFIHALNKSNYYCKKLNESALYVTGPTFDSNEFNNIATTCKDYINSDNATFKVTAIIHELYDINIGTHNNWCSTNSTNNSIDNSINNNSTNYHELGSVNIVKDHNLDKLDHKSRNLSSEHHCFGIIFINNERETQDRKRKKNRLKKGNNINAVGLPSFKIMNKLHHQPCPDKDKLYFYNVEMFGFDDCYNDLDLKVSRKYKLKNAIYLLIQLLFLPIFVLIPLKWILHKCNMDDENIDDLDISQQVTYDIYYLWGYKYSNKKFKRVITRLVSFVLASILFTVIIGGPCMYNYRYKIEPDYYEDLLAFDCFGPLGLYLLWVFTLLLRNIAVKTCIAPQEHFLLYNKMVIEIVHEPKYFKGTDLAVLGNTSDKVTLTTHAFGFVCGFMELRGPKNGILSKKVCTFSRCIIYLIISTLFWMANNVENFIHFRKPMHIEGVEHLNFKRVYIWFSAFTELVLLMLFLIMWETIINRIERQFSNIQTLSDILVRNTKTEYINFNNMENILSWLQLHNFVKRKGLVLFSSLETSILSLLTLALCSLAGLIYCIFNGVGAQIHNEHSLFSSSSLASWFFLALLSFIEVFRVLYYGHKYNRESEKQEIGIRKQSQRMTEHNILKHLCKDNLTIDIKLSIDTAHKLLSHIVHEDIVPNVFGIKFDKLFAKTVFAAVISSIPGIVRFLISLFE